MGFSHIISTLQEKWRHSQMGHFYLIKPCSISTTPDQDITHFLDRFLTPLLQENLDHQTSFQHINEVGHSDILMIDQRSAPQVAEGKFYLYSEKENDFESFYRFMDYRPISLPYKIAIIDHIHLISTPQMNMLLKTLEEPSERTIIFFRASNHAKVPPTINSRAIKINLPLLNQKNDIIIDRQEELTELILGKKWSIISEKLKKKPELERDFLQLSLNIAQKNHTFEKQQNYLNALQSFQESQTFNNQRAQRVIELLSTL